MDEREEILEEVQNIENTEIEACEEIEEVIEETETEVEEIETEIECEEELEDEEQDYEEYYKSKKPLGQLITLVAFTAIMLVSSTYAWFSAQKTVDINNLEGKVNVAEGLEISLDAEHWSQEINFEDYDTSASGIAVYGNSLAAQYSADVHNHLPTELLPVSTTATAATYESDGETIKTGANGIGLTDVAFYMGDVQTTGTLSDTVTSLHSVIQADESIATSTTDGYAGYFAIDLFLRNSSKMTASDTQGESKETLQLNTNSMLELVTGGATSTGLQNTVRVALALYEPDLTVTGANVGITANQEQILAATTGDSIKIEDVAIWEPNADQHVDYIVTNNNLLYWDATQEDLYLDAFGTYNATTGAYETKTAVTGRSRFTETDRIPTYALTKEAVSSTAELAAKTTKIANIYKWDGTVTGLDKQVTLQTKKSASDYSITDGGVRNLVSIKSPKTIIYDQGDEEDVVEFQIYKNQVSRLRMYVWLEGQDVDCINYASHGSGIHLDLGLIKSAEVGASGDEADVTLPSTSETTPYLPTTFSYDGTTDLASGLTIKDGAQNEYVWVEVPRNTTIYDEAGLNLDLDNLSGTNLTNAYTAIEKDLHDYTGTEYTDVHSGNDASVGLTSTQYTELKNKMLKSVYENGGFYIGKYETGTLGTYRDYGTDFTTEHPITETPVIQANAYPYGFVTAAQAQTLASSMASGGYTSSLMFDIQWDLTLKYLESKGVSSTLLYNNSTSWGNYVDSTFSIADGNIRYNAIDLDTFALTEWLPATTFTHNSGDTTLLTTGASSNFQKMGIYDLAGNAFEWTLGYVDSSSPCVIRGGDCFDDGSAYPADDLSSGEAGSSFGHVGFRVSLF